LRRLGIKPILAKRKTEPASGRGKHPWVAERTPSRLHPLRRRRVRDEGRDDIHQALLTLGCIVTCGYFA